MQVTLRQETKHRPMDLRAERPRAMQNGTGGLGEAASALDGSSHEWEVALKIASNIALEARTAVKVPAHTL